MPLVGPTKAIMAVPVGRYKWHEFFPNGNAQLFCYFFLFLFLLYGYLLTHLCFGTVIVKHNYGVVIAIWAPIVLVSTL